MEARIQLGGTLDVVSRGELDESLDGLKNDIFDNNKTAKPVFNNRSKADLTPSSGALVLDLGSPPVGRLWNVLAITTFGSDDSTTVANAAVALYTGNPDNVGLADLLVPSISVPTFLGFTKGVLWCYPDEDLVCRVTGASSGVQVGVNISIAEWREPDILNRSGR